MNKFQQWVQNFMKGRAGSDDLSFALLISGIVIMVLGSVFESEIGVMVCTLISIILFVVVVSRTLSHDVAKRRAENQKFQALFHHNKQSDSIKAAKKEQKRIIKEKQKTHVMFYCPDCKASCWVPKNKGKVRITCPKCGSKFIGKT